MFLYLLGWGLDDFGGVKQEILQKALVPPWSNQRCQQAYPRLKLDAGHLCAGYEQGAIDACQVMTTWN